MIDIEWSDCIVDGCSNKCCLRLNSNKCYPHTLGIPIDSWNEFIVSKEMIKEEEFFHDPAIA